MKTLGKLKINSEKLLKDEELKNLQGGLSYECCCFYCSGCAPTCGIAIIPEGYEPNSWAAEQGNYEFCNCIGGF